MSEFYENDKNPTPPEVASLDSIADVFENWRAKPTGDDIKIAHFSGAALELLEDPTSNFRLSIESMIEFRSDPEGSSFISADYRPSGHPVERKALTARYAGNLIQKAIQHEFIYTPHLNYPLEIKTQEDWKREIQRLLDDPARYDSFDANIWWREIQSNVSDRYKGVKLAYQYYRDQLPDEVSMLDVGCSLNLGYKKILSHETFRKASIFSDISAEGIINNAIRRRITAKNAVGVDAWDVREQSSRRWIRSCSFYPSELLSVRKVLNFDRTALRSVDNLYYFHHDFSDQETPEEWDGKKYDVITFITVLYECSEEQRKQMLENATELLSENGIIVIQDLVDVVKDPQTGEFNFKYYDDFTVPGLYKTIAWAPHRGEKPQILIEWENARCLSAVPGADLNLQRLQR